MHLALADIHHVHPDGVGHYLWASEIVCNQSERRRHVSAVLKDNWCEVTTHSGLNTVYLQDSAFTQDL